MKIYTKFYLYFLIIIQPFIAFDLFANQNQVTLNLKSYDKKITIIEAKGRDYGIQLFAMVSNTAQALVSEAFIKYKVQDINLDGNDELLVQVSGGIETALHIPHANLEILSGVGHDLPKPLLGDIADMIAKNAIQS